MKNALDFYIATVIPCDVDAISFTAGCLVFAARGSNMQISRI